MSAEAGEFVVHAPGYLSERLEVRMHRYSTDCNGDEVDVNGYPQQGCTMVMGMGLAVGRCDESGICGRQFEH